MATTNSRFQRRYPPEMRERAVRMVRESIAESGERVGAVTRVARQLGIGPESLRNWVKQAEIDSGSFLDQFGLPGGALAASFATTSGKVSIEDMLMGPSDEL